MSVEGHWGQDLNKRARPGSHDFSVDHHCTATGLQSVPRRGEKILPSEPQKLDSVDLFPVYSLTGETRKKSTLSRPPSWFTSSLLRERRHTMDPMWEGESWLLDGLLRSPVTEQGYSRSWPLWSSGPHLLKSTVDPVMSSGFKCLWLNLFKHCFSVRKQEGGCWTLDTGIVSALQEASELTPFSSEPPVPLPQHGKYYDFSMCSRTQRKAGKHCFQRI